MDDTANSQRAQFLKDEYVMVQGFYEDIDRRALTVKGWGVTLTAALVAAGVPLHLYLHPAFWCAIAGIGLVFWYLEADYRSLADYFSLRIKEIERIFRDDGVATAVPLQTYAVWTSTYDAGVRRQRLKHFKRLHVFMPHAVIVVASSLVALALLIWPGH